MSSNNYLYGERSNGGQHGDVFTSPVVVSYMLDKVGYTPDRDLRQTRILEPSCGEGEFVVEIVNRLIQSALRFSFDANEAFRRNVRAYDIDTEKITKCRARIEAMGIISYEECICVSDFLKMGMEKTDIVVGNPPYIRYENIPYEMLDYCKYTFSTFHYRCDLYVPFYEKSLALLAAGGKHCFICSNRWLKNEYGNVCTEMSDEYVCELIDSTYLRKYGKSSIHLLSTGDRQKIAASLHYEHNIPFAKANRCMCI